jgi:hypothetical protein
LVVALAILARFSGTVLTAVMDEMVTPKPSPTRPSGRISEVNARSMIGRVAAQWLPAAISTRPFASLSTVVGREADPRGGAQGPRGVPGTVAGTGEDWPAQAGLSRPAEVGAGRGLRGAGRTLACHHGPPECRSERAASGPFGAPIAHGYMTLSLFIPLFTELLEVEGVTTRVNHGLNKVRFPAPVRVGSRIRLAARLAEVEEVPGGLQVTLDGTVEIDGEAKPVAMLQSVSLLRLSAAMPRRGTRHEGRGRSRYAMRSWPAATGREAGVAGRRRARRPR